MVSGKIKVLHVLGGLDRGGVETWLMHVLRHMDRERFQFDFLVHAERECAYDEEARSLGSRVIPNPDPHNPVRYAWNFIKNYRKYGPYDVVHSHVHHYSGFTLLLARLVGVPKRVAHSHNDTRVAENNARIARKAYLKAMEYLIGKNATHGLAASREAAACLYGKGWEKDGRWSVLHCGIDLDPFNVKVNKKEVRRELGLPEGAFVIGHVGRFSPQKNHKFLLEIVAEVFKNCDNCWLLLVGDGPLRHEMEELAESLGIADRVIFAGARPDVPRLMRGAMDLFLFPSLYEGLGIVLLEAQAAGLPCVISDVIPEEVDVVTDKIRRLSLNDPPSVWTDKIRKMTNEKGTIDQGYCVNKMMGSSFNIDYCLSQLMELYNAP